MTFSPVKFANSDNDGGKCLKEGQITKIVCKQLRSHHSFDDITVTSKFLNYEI